MRYIVAFFCLLTLPLRAATHCVLPGASGTGASWSDALGVLPSSPTRGDTYYVASGTYPRYTINAVAGTDTITIKKATIAEHGSSTGWSDSYATGPAIWISPGAAAIWVKCSNVTWDGVTGTGTNGTDYGFQAQWTNTTAGNVVNDWSYQGSVIGVGAVAPACMFFDNSTSIATNIVRSFWVRSYDRDVNGGQSAASLWIGGNTTINQGNYFTNCLFTDFEGIQLNTAVIDSMFERCFFVRSGSGISAAHSGAFMLQQSTNLTIRYCLFDSMWGTANTSIVDLPGGGIEKDIYVYGNIFQNSYPTTPIGNGLIYAPSTTDSYPLNLCVYNNTFVGWTNITMGFGVYNAPGYMLLSNNLIQGCNWSVTNFIGDVRSGSNVWNLPAASFANSNGMDWHLTAATYNGVTLAAPFNVDPDGVTRGVDGTWDIGAYEYTAGGTAPSITVQPQNATVTAPATASFSVTATGDAPLSYQWHRAGTNVTGATASNYVTPPTATGDSGQAVSVTVTNASGSVTSGNATLTVNAPSLAVGSVTTLNVGTLRISHP